MRTLGEVPGVEFAAFCDLDEEMARACVEKYGGRAYRDHREMLEEAGIDACYVCLPPFAHTDQELLCCEKGISLFVEKPVALTVEKAREVAAAVRKSGVVNQVGYQRRFSGPMNRIREVLHREGGPIALFDAAWYGGVAGGPEKWWRRRERSGGQLVEQSTHLVDLARWYVGDVSEVYAGFETKVYGDLPNFNIEDASVVTMRFANGALGVITSTCAAQQKGRGQRFAVVAKNLQVTGGRDGLRIIRGGEVEEVGPQREAREATLEGNRHFIECVQGGRQTRVPYEEGLKALEITLAAVRSADTGRVVKLPLP